MEFREAVPYVVSAYMGIWLAILVYLLVMQGKLTALGEQVKLLNKAVEKKSAEKEPETVNA
ncbi:MAG: CcmD family protein [Actinobacteria bacterium]|nr:CcmD family protein [Actinomycetota bacterium]